MPRRRLVDSQQIGDNGPDENLEKSTASFNSFDPASFLKNVSLDYVNTDIPDTFSELIPHLKYSPEFTGVLRRYLDPSIV